MGFAIRNGEVSTLQTRKNHLEGKGCLRFGSVICVVNAGEILGLQ